MTAELPAQKPGDVRLDPASGDYFVTVMNDAGELVEMRVVPPNKVVLDMALRVESVVQGRWRYSYSVTVLPGSIQPLSFFEVDCPALAGIGGLSATIPHPWAVRHSSEVSLPSCDFSQRGTLTLPVGGTLLASLEAGYLPSRGAARAFGAAEGVRWPTFDPIEENAPAVAVVNRLEGFSGGWKEIPTVVPGRDPATITDAGVGLGLVREDLDASCGTLGWIGDAAVCTLLHGSIAEAQTAWGQGNVASTRTAIDAFLATLTAHHDSTGTGPITDNAFWLLTVNAEFIRDLLPAGGASVTLPLAADTYLRSGSPNQNQGTEPILRLRASGNNRALLRLDSAAVATAVESGTVTSARLELTITLNADNWGATGRTIDLHRLTQAWTEAGATWNCGDDLDPGNQKPDCPLSAWEMGGAGPHPWIATPTATPLITNGLRGVITFDVTSDIQAMLGGGGITGDGS